MDTTKRLTITDLLATAVAIHFEDANPSAPIRPASRTMQSRKHDRLHVFIIPINIQLHHLPCLVYTEHTLKIVFQSYAVTKFNCVSRAKSDGASENARSNAGLALVINSREEHCCF